jgi:hypothetical protein
MALQTATNPQTGESVALVNGNWQPITQTATNPKTGESVGLIGNEWVPIPGAAPKPTQAAASGDFDFGSPMGTGAEEIMAQASKPRKVYTGSVFDTQPFNPPFDPAEAERMSRRAYAEEQAAPERRVQEMRATPKDVLERSAVKAAGDTTIGILQGMVSFPKSIVDNIPFDNPLSQFYKDAYEAGEKSKSGYLRSKNVERSANLENIRKNQGELAATRASFNTMFSPSGADVVAQGAGSLVPTTGLSMLNLGLKSMTAMNALANAGDAAQQTAAKLADMSPEQWSNSAAYQTLREKGLNHTDAVRMLAPLYALPSQIMGGITGAVSGATGLEKALVKGGAKTARARAGRAGAELLGEEFESLAPEFTGNVTRRLLDDKASLLDGLGQTAVETLFGTIPGATLAAAKSKGHGKPAPAATRVEPTLAPQETQPAVSPAVLPTEAPPTVLPTEAPPAVSPTVAEPTEQVQAIADRLQQERGLSRKTALAMAERQVGAQVQPTTEGAQDVTRPNAEPDRTSVPVAEPAAPVASTTGEPTGAERNGVVPVEQNVGEPVAGKVAEPATVAETPTALAETKDRLVTTHDGEPWTYFFPGAEVVQMRYPGAPAKVIGVEETRGQPTTYELEVDVSKHPDGIDDNGDRVNTKTVRVTDDELNRFNPPNETTAPAGEAAVQAAPAETTETQAINPPTEGVNLAPETIETQQAEAQQQEAPAAAGVTPAKRGRPAVQQTHVVAENPEGGFNHVTNGEVVAAYANKKQATAAVDLAKAQDKGNPELIAKNQARLDAALASQGRGRPAGVKVEGKEKVSQKDKVEINALESALDTYNSPDSDTTQIKLAAGYIHDVANDKTAPEKARERARQMLEEQVDEKDLPRNKRALPSKFTNAPANTKFSKVTNASEAVGLIADTGTLFQKEVAKRLRNSVVGIKFVVLEEGDAIPSEMDNARGLFEYNPGTNKHVIYVRGASFGDMQGINNVTVLHELLHAATAKRIEAGLFGGTKNAQLTKFMNEMQTLMKRVEAAYESGVRRGIVSAELQDLVEADAENTKYDENDNPKFEIFNSPHEFLAYGMSSDEFQRFLMRIKGTRTSETGFSKFVNTIRDLFSVKPSEATAFTDLVNITDDVLNTNAGAAPTQRQAFQQAGLPNKDERTEAEKKRAVRHALNVVDKSFKAEEISKSTEVLQRLRSLNVMPVLKEAMKGASYKQKQAIAKIFGTPLVAEVGGVNVPELVNTNHLLEQMDGAKMQMIKAGARVVEDIKRLVPTQKGRDKVSYASLVFTVSGIDPRVDRSQPELNDIYNALTDSEKKALDKIVAFYDDNADHFDFILEENAKALRPGEAQKLIAAVREVLGKDKRIAFYTPLSRDQSGNFWLRVGSGKNTEFYTRKTLAERDRLAEYFAKERNTSTNQLLEDKEIEMGNDIGVLRNKVLDSSDALRKLFLMIDDADFTAEEHGASLQQAKDGMKDSVFQLWLHMQPENSARKQFIHRRKYPPAGFRTDVLQNLSESVLKYATHLSRLEYAPQLRRSIAQAQASIEGRSEYTPYVAEMALRVNDTLSPEKQSNGMAVARFANSFTFAYYMSESTAVLQLLSVYQVGTAQLIKHYPAAAVAKEMASMASVWNTMGVKNEHGEWIMPTIESALNVKSSPSDSPATRLRKEQDREFITAMHELNVAESTGARDLQGYKDMPTEKYGSKYEQAKRVARFVVGGLIHSTERMSREIMFMSSAHLARDKAVAEFRKTAEYKNAPDKVAAERAFGKANMDKWATRAAKDTNLALFDYSESAKPRYMRNALGKVSLQFFTYQLNVGSFLLRNLLGMIKPLPGETRTECFRAFNTLMATTWTLGGTAAMFGVPIVFGLVSAVMKLRKDPDEPDELKDLDSFEAYKVWLHSQLGDVTIGGKPLDTIIDQGPVNAFTGLDVSSRTSLSNILVPPEVKAARTPREGVMNYAQMLGGANLQAVMSVADGAGMFIKGEHYRGIEKMVPSAFIRNKMTAYRYATEGETGVKLGDEVIDAKLFYLGELLGQSVGLRPILAVDVARENRKVNELATKVVAERADILDQIERADRKDDIDASIATREAKDKFNAKYKGMFPEAKITNEDVFNFKKGRNEARRKSWAGLEYTKQNKLLAEELTGPSRDALIRREKEIAAREKAE